VPTAPAVRTSAPRAAGRRRPRGGAARRAAVPGDGRLRAVPAPEEGRRGQGRGVLAAAVSVAVAPSPDPGVSVTKLVQDVRLEL
jgi:hypothetical protein